MDTDQLQGAMGLTIPFSALLRLEWNLSLASKFWKGKTVLEVYKFLLRMDPPTSILMQHSMWLSIPWFLNLPCKFGKQVCGNISSGMVTLNWTSVCGARQYTDLCLRLGELTTKFLKRVPWNPGNETIHRLATTWMWCPSSLTCHGLIRGNQTCSVGSTCGLL